MTVTVTVYPTSIAGLCGAGCMDALEKVDGVKHVLECTSDLPQGLVAPAPCTPLVPPGHVAGVRIHPKVKLVLW